MAKQITAADLRQFTGSEQYFRHSLARRVLYTEGVQFLAENAGAYWLVDKVAIMQIEPKVRAQEFQVWKLRVDGGVATLTCDDGNGDEGTIVHSEHISFTDFPLDGIDLWVEGAPEQPIILLPSEH